MAGCCKGLGEQLIGAESLKVNFVTMQSYLGAHRDIVFVYETKVVEDGKALKVKEPFTDVSFCQISALPSEKIAEYHLEVLDELEISNASKEI